MCHPKYGTLIGTKLESEGKQDGQRKPITKDKEYAVYLQSEERSKNTVAKYARDLRAFLIFIRGGEITKTTVLDWKDKPECKVKLLKIQREIFAKPETEPIFLVRLW